MSAVSLISNSEKKQKTSLVESEVFCWNWVLTQGFDLDDSDAGFRPRGLVGIGLLFHGVQVRVRNSLFGTVDNFLGQLAVSNVNRGLTGVGVGIDNPLIFLFEDNVAVFRVVDAVFAGFVFGEQETQHRIVRKVLSRSAKFAVGQEEVFAGRCLKDKIAFAGAGFGDVQVFEHPLSRVVENGEVVGLRGDDVVELVVDDFIHRLDDDDVRKSVPDTDILRGLVNLFGKRDEVGVVAERFNLGAIAGGGAKRQSDSACR